MRCWKQQQQIKENNGEVHVKWLDQELLSQENMKKIWKGKQIKAFIYMTCLLYTYDAADE